MNPYIWSGQQDGVFTFLVDEEGHLIVRARAGTGKTTTIVEAVKRYLLAHPTHTVVVCAFNKKIADELTKRFAGHKVEVKTLHSLGYSIIKRYWEGVHVEPKERTGERAKALTERVTGVKVPDAVKKLITKLHTIGRETMPHAANGEALLDLAYTFECEPDEQWHPMGFTIEFVCAAAAKAMAFAANEKPNGMEIDFADMIFLPVRNHWLYKWADLVVVDEAQDMTFAQLEIARGICRGRLCLVGDDRQAIYAFRGADAGSLDRLKGELQAFERGLTTTYRCGRAIVRLAATLVPDFEAGEHNPEGTVTGLHKDDLAEMAQVGDFVLSRTNAPLVSTAMNLLRAGKRTRIAGKEIGKGLITLVQQIAKGARSVPDFLDRLAAWEDRNIARAKAAKREAQMDDIHDRASMLRHLAEDVKNLAQIEERITMLFTDDGKGQDGVVTCSSIHRAKGLEANRVFVLADTLRDHSIEEQNLRYVAITRAKQNLVMVEGAV